MVYLFTTYIAFIILLIVRNYKSKNVFWLYMMLTGFCLAFIGLASFTEFIYSVNYTESKLFQSVSRYIWMLNYYLQLDVLKDYRIINIGIAFYVYGAICFSFSYANIQKFEKWGVWLLALLPGAIIFIYDPETLKIIYGVQKDFLTAIANRHADQILRILNFIFYWLVKSCLIVSIGILIYVYRRIIPILRKKFMYMIVGIIPIHVLFLVLFYWYPNNINKIVFIRYNQISNISIPYNEFLYGLITYLGIFSIFLLIYAMLKYNIFEINVRQKRVNFERQFDTAHVGLKVFSHSIKNQFIAVKLLSEQLNNHENDSRKKEIIKEILAISNNSIGKLSSLTREMGVVKLKYERANIYQLLEYIVKKHQNINRKIEFTLEGKDYIFLKIDLKQFEKVLDNIIINGVEACQGVEYPKIKVTVSDQNNYAIIRVIDNGKGIDQKNLKKVFEPFFSTKPTLSNWGIGLSYCQKVVEAFGGVISINSEIDQGTMVLIYIPTTKR